MFADLRFDLPPEKHAHVLTVADMIELSTDHATIGGMLTFRRFTDEMDVSRKESFRAICPELDDMISDYLARH